MSNISKDSNALLPTGYVIWRKNRENLIDTAKVKTAISVNMCTLSLYWSIGKSILQKQEQERWGTQVIEQLSKDLLSHYPDDRGYSIRNLRYMKRFASEYPEFPILQVSLAELKKLPILQATLAELENEGNWVKKEIKISLKICWFRKIFVPLYPLVPAKPLNDAQMCGSFYFYTFPLLRFSYFQTILISL